MERGRGILDRDVGFGSYEGEIGSECDKSGTFSDQISVHFGSTEI